MKLKGKKKIFIVLIVLVVLMSIFIFSNNSSQAEDIKVINTEENIAEVSSQTILTTLTAPGEVKSETTEKLTLNTNYKYLTMCAEKEELVKEGENLLKYTNGKFITAPYDCVILDYYVPTAKESCTDSNYINISSVEDLYMDINIGEDEIEKITVGQEVDIVANYDESKTYKGTITKINATGTRSSGRTTFAAIASIKNDDSLKLGMSATCTVTIEKQENLVCLPIEAIEIENDERYVNLLNDAGEKVRTKVETGKSDSNYVQITSGVSLGDKVYYETQTVTVTSSSEEETSENALTSLFNSGKPSGKGFNRGGN